MKLLFYKTSVPRVVEKLYKEMKRPVQQQKKTEVG